MKRTLQILIPLLLVLALIWWVQRQLTVTVLVAPAVTGTAVNAVTGTVEIFAYMDIDVKAQHRGQLTAIPVVAGQQVAAGDVIAMQASEELDLRIEQVKIRLEAAEARAELERRNAIDLETIRQQIEGVRLAVQLRQTPESRLQDLLREERKLLVALRGDEIRDHEEFRLLKNQLAQLELQREQMITVAPFSGTVAVVKAFQGDLVNAGQALVRLVSHGRFAIMELTEEDYFGVEDGQQVTVRLASYPDRTFKGKVSRLEDIANSGNKTRNVIVTMEASDSELVPGLTGEGFLVKAERANAVLIPRRALIGQTVYVVRDGRVERRPIRHGFLGLNQAEIVEGLSAGEIVILEDQSLLRPGDRVKTVSGR